MTYLVGAWCRARDGLHRDVDEATRARLRTQLPDRGYHEWVSPRGWLVGPRAGCFPSSSPDDGLASAQSSINPASPDLGWVAIEGVAASVRPEQLAAALFLGGPGPTSPPRKMSGVPSRLRTDFAPPGHASVASIGPQGSSLVLSRGLTGGERLYYADVGDTVLFAGSLRYLLAHPAIQPRLSAARVPETLLTGLTLFGEGTLVSGINEVKPGHTLVWSDHGCEDRWHGPDLMAEPEGESDPDLARSFHDALMEGIESSIGTTRPVAVTLSGGIDSSAIAALAVEAYGADNVQAFTYEFDDPAHPCETPYAEAVCRRLGIRQHHVFRLSFAKFLTDIPETLWRTEAVSHWPKAYNLQLIETLRAHGFDRVLTGFGIGSHMGYFDDLAHCLAAMPRATVAPWPFESTRHGRWLRIIERAHPGLAFPGWRLLLPFLWVLRERGYLTSLARFYPNDAKPIADAVPIAAGAEAQWVRDGSLTAVLRQLSFDRMFSCVDVTRWEKLFRERGVMRISPAHYAKALPFAYLPPGPRRLWTEGRALRPGKLLLRKMMEGTLPDDVLYRKKSWADAVISPRWFEAGARWMAANVAAADPLAEVVPTLVESADRWDRRAPQASVTALRFWHRMFLDGHLGNCVPTWSSVAERK